MSVLIRGMEMPSCCMFCPVSNSIGCGLTNPPIVMTSKEMLAGRPDWCPLVSIPPHGDLIGRNPLIDIAMHLRNRAKDEYTRRMIDSVIRYIAEAPTIIPAEEAQQ